MILDKLDRQELAELQHAANKLSREIDYLFDSIEAAEMYRNITDNIDESDLKSSLESVDNTVLDIADHYHKFLKR